MRNNDRSAIPLQLHAIVLNFDFSRSCYEDKRYKISQYCGLNERERCVADVRVEREFQGDAPIFGNCVELAAFPNISRPLFTL